MRRCPRCGATLKKVGATVWCVSVKWTGERYEHCKYGVDRVVSAKR